MTAYRTTPSATTPVDAIRVPGVRPAEACGARSGGHMCTRPAGHGRRHAAIRWWDRNVVRAVWDQVPR